MVVVVIVIVFVVVVVVVVLTRSFTGWVCPATSTQAPNYGDHLLVDMTPSPAPVCGKKYTQTRARHEDTRAQTTKSESAILPT